MLAAVDAEQWFRQSGLAGAALVVGAVEFLAQAPFNPGFIRVDRHLRGLAYQGITLKQRALATDYHLIKRIIVDREWANGTAFAEYLIDVHNAARSGSSRLAMYFYREENYAAIIATTAEVIPPARLGPDSEPSIFVLYSADRGINVTGYQCEGLSTLDLPGGITWHQ